MATLMEHAKAIGDAIEAAEIDGFSVNSMTCCCGEGLEIEDPSTLDCEVIL
jgi:hypothetical protein